MRRHASRRTVLSPTATHTNLHKKLIIETKQQKKKENKSLFFFFLITDINFIHSLKIIVLLIYDKQTNTIEKKHK